MSAMERDELDLTQLTPETLTALNDWDMRSVVAADMRRHASNERIRTTVPSWISEALRGPLLDRWHTAMQQMLASVNSQLEVLENQHEQALAYGAPGNQERGRYHTARTGPMRFRAAILEALPEAERLLQQRQEETLAEAIRVHREATRNDATISPSVADEALWAMLDQKDQHQHETDARSTTPPRSGR